MPPWLVKAGVSNSAGYAIVRASLDKSTDRWAEFIFITSAEKGNTFGWICLFVCLFVGLRLFVCLSAGLLDI